MFNIIFFFQILLEVGFSSTGLRCSQRSPVLSCYSWPEDITPSTFWLHTGSQHESGGCITPWPTMSVWKGKLTILKITWTEFGGGTSSDILNVVFLVTYRGGLVGRFPKSCVDGNRHRSFSGVARWDRQRHQQCRPLASHPRQKSMSKDRFHERQNI